jgi:hypothetical protein
VGLYLLEDGTLALGKRGGTWSRYVGDVSELELWLRPVEPDEALRHFRIEQILDGMIGVLSSHEVRASATATIRERGERLADALRTVTTFLGAK